MAWWVGEEDGAYRAHHHGRHHVPGQFWLGAIGSDDFTPEDLAALRTTVTRSIVDMGETEDAMIEAVRRVAARTSPPVIGQNCMTVTMSAGQPPLIDVRYRPVIDARAEIRQAGRELVELPAAFSPFVVGPFIAAFPAVIVGGGNSFGLGPFEVSIDAPDLPPGQSILTAMGSQPRPRL